MIQEIKELLEKISGNGEWYAYNFPSAGWQIATKKCMEYGYNGNVGGTYRKSSYGDVFFNAWWQFPSKYMNSEIEEANAKFIANSPKYIKTLLKRIEELENKLNNI